MTDIDLSNRTDSRAAFDERATLTQLLRYVRLTVHAKCVGLSQSDAVQTPLPSSPAMSIAGLVSHLRWSEAFWIDVVFLGRPNQWPGTDDDSELQMRVDSNNPWPNCSTSTPSRQPTPTTSLPPATGTQRRRPGREHRQAVRVAVHHHAPDRGDRPAQRPPRHPPRARRWRHRRLITRISQSAPARRAASVPLCGDGCAAWSGC